MPAVVSAREVAAACGGRVVRGDPSVVLEGVGTDSRQVMRGQLFVALRGQRHDGHRFVDRALAAGAGGAMVEQGRLDCVPDGPWPVVEVQDSLRALQELAAWWRTRLAAQVLAVTGSVGKTTTKEMMAAILGCRHKVVRAPASYNNEVGVPLALLQAGPETQAVVLELAMRGPGQIAQLAQLCRPQVGVITNVGESHLELLQSREAIARAKGELLEHLPAGGTAVLNADDALVMSQAHRCPPGCRTITFGSRQADVVYDRVEGGGLGGTRFRLRTPWGEVHCRLGVPGAHLVANAAAAAAAALAAGALLQDVEEGLASFSGSAMRMQVVRAGGAVVLHDAYNASPTSVRAALATLARVAAEERLRAVAVLGDMLELGPESEQLHQQVGRLAAQSGVQWLVTVGRWAQATARGAQEGGMPAEAIHQVQDAEEAARVVRGRVGPGDVVLVKGSRAVGLERVVQALGEEEPR